MRIDARFELDALDHRPALPHMLDDANDGLRVGAHRHMAAGRAALAAGHGLGPGQDLFELAIDFREPIDDVFREQHRRTGERR